MNRSSIILSILLFCSMVNADDFLREFPSEALRGKLIPENFKGLDAVIIVKEQSFVIENTEITYRGFTLEGPRTTRTNVRIIKLFNEKAVQRYGSFEYEYPEFFGDEIKNGFMARARIMKPDGSIWIMPEEEVKIIESIKDYRGRPLARKALFKIPNLAVGDLLQIEYQMSMVFTKSASGIFYYNDKDFVLFSNLYITLPAREDARYVNLPANRIGEPRVQQLSKKYGAGKTYFWSVQNLQPVPDEPFSLPFADRSLMTAFIVEKRGRKYIGDWNTLTMDFYEDLLEEDNVKSSRIEELGFTSSRPENPGRFEVLDSLYRTIRERIRLTNFNVIYPRSEDIDGVFEKGEGDASDLAYIMYRILKRWGYPAQMIWIRDRREGVYERIVPSTSWFDRLAVLVTLDRVEKVYDFDRCISFDYQTPWFLKGINVVVLSKNGCQHKRINPVIDSGDNRTLEHHTLTFDSEMNLRDSIHLTFCGSQAERLRGEYYDTEKTEIQRSLSGRFASGCLSETEMIFHNDFYLDKDLYLDLKGPADIEVAHVDSFLTFRLTNYSIRNLREKLYSAVRFRHINFDGPMQFELVWDVCLPAGYQVRNDNLVTRRISGPRQISAKLSYDESEGVLRAVQTLRFSRNFIEVSEYHSLIAYLDEVLRELNKDIILEKI